LRAEFGRGGAGRTEGGSGRGAGNTASLDTDVRYIKGIGEARAKALAKLNIATLQDLVMDFPRAYEDRTAFKSVGDLVFGESVCVRAAVVTQPRVQYVRKGMELLKLRVSDGSGVLGLTFFNQGYLRDSLRQGETYIFFGRVGGLIGLPEMTNPVFERAEAAGAVTGRIVPVYRLTAGVSQNLMRRAVAAGLEACGEVLPDPLPRSVQAGMELAQSRLAYENVHFPRSFGDLELARQRLIFEEFFVLTCALDEFRKKRAVRRGVAMSGADPEEFFAALPFRPTGAQRRAVDEAFADLRRNVPMSRLVQGDVGSGKTVVAAACCWFAYRSGCQSAFMAPTEILAEQHYRTLTEMLGPLGVRVALLTGGMKPVEKRGAKTLAKTGAVDVVVGTHALLTGDVEFSRLGLVVADEQHRFGVQQRAALTEKGDCPHVLVMSATPIPRTLALIVYGDLDVSVIDELPPGRQKVDTFAVGEELRERVNAFIRRQVAQGRQVFVVCPAVEENEEYDAELAAAKEYEKKLAGEVFPDLRVALMHGKLRPREKAAVMEAFVRGEVDILVATTVIEVGVDVPNASLMVVENADRFGLSQLHQLRGRVGRGPYKSYCILFEGAGGDAARERLHAMCATNDGFKIAEEDLRQRGPGDFFGSRQSGLPEMHIANFASDVDLLRRAQTAARQVMDGDPRLEKAENALLRKSVERMAAAGEGTLN